MAAVKFKGLGDYWRHLPKRTRNILLTCLYGLDAGVLAVAFQLAMNAAYYGGLVELSHLSKPAFLAWSFVIVVGSSLLVGWLLTAFCPEAAGSGIPQLKIAFWKDFGYVPWRVAWVKFLAGVLSIGGGSSLGREGPSVQLAGAAASNLAGVVGEPKQNRRSAAACGAASGLAAAFNTPLASVTFVLEEIIGDLNSRFLGSVLLASVLGALVVHGIIGQQPAFTLEMTDSPTWLGYALTPVVAALASVIGVWFQRLSLRLRHRIKPQQGLPRWMWPAVGGAITWALGSAVFWNTGHLGVFSLGYDDLSSALAGDIGWQIAAVLLVTKFIATFSCYGFGGCGGIFSPTLFFGGMAGVMIAGMANWVVQATGGNMEMHRADTITLAVVGMSACLGAVVWAPVTGILIVFEMTHDFGLVPTLMVGALISQTISRRMNKENFYDELISQDGHQIEHVKPPRDLQSWQQLPISAIANFKHIVVRRIDPDHIEELLRDHPYDRFPVLIDGVLKGVLPREEAKQALAEKREPVLEPAVTCFPEQTIKELQLTLIESRTGMVILVNRLRGRMLGLVTLHDLLRAQHSMAKEMDRE